LICEKCSTEQKLGDKFCGQCGNGTFVEVRVNVSPSLNLAEEEMQFEILKARKFMENGQITEAEDILLDLYKTYKRDLELLDALGCLYLKKGKQKDASYFFEEALDINPNYKLEKEYENHSNSFDTFGEEWYYTLNGRREGPVQNNYILKMIGNGTINNSNLVWSKNLNNWTPIAETIFAKKSNTPPPLLGISVNNTLVWWLAFVPIIGLIVENVIANQINRDLSYLWIVTLALNILFCILDEKNLKRAGYQTGNIVGWAFFLVPIYLFKRASLLKQKPYYAIIWCLMFALLIFAPSAVINNLGISNNQTVNEVKNGYLTLYPDKTLGEAINGFFGNPKWESIKATDGNIYVNITGKITSNGQLADAILQYEIDNSTFVFHSFEINGVPQNMLMYSQVLDEMYKK
jgi:hypothetical protein